MVCRLVAARWLRALRLVGCPDAGQLVEQRVDVDPRVAVVVDTDEQHPCPIGPFERHDDTQRPGKVPHAEAVDDAAGEPLTHGLAAAVGEVTLEAVVAGTLPAPQGFDHAVGDGGASDLTAHPCCLQRRTLVD